MYPTLLLLSRNTYEWQLLALSGSSHVDKIQFLTGSYRPVADVHNTNEVALSGATGVPPDSGPRLC